MTGCAICGQQTETPRLARREDDASLVTEGPLCEACARDVIERWVAIELSPMTKPPVPTFVAICVATAWFAIAIDAPFWAMFPLSALSAFAYEGWLTVSRRLRVGGRP